MVHWSFDAYVVACISLFIAIRYAPASFRAILRTFDCNTKQRQRVDEFFRKLEWVLAGVFAVCTCVAFVVWIIAGDLLVLNKLHHDGWAVS